MVQCLQREYGIRSVRFHFAFLTLAFASALVRADDWPQWLGPQRDAVWRESGLLEKFPATGPSVRWRAPIGGGYSGPAVAEGRVYLLDRQLAKDVSNPRNAFERGRIPGSERVLCLNEADGKLLWVHEYDCPYTVSYAAGPRATPLVSGGKVYTLGAEGNLCCLDAGTGQEIWARDFKKDFGVTTPMWGFAGHPLLDGNKLICLAGGDGSVAVAFDKDTGKELWRALSAREPGYAPPMIYEAGGKRQLIVWHPEALNSLDPETGALYWSEPGKANAGMTIATPRKLGDLLYVTSFYNGSVMLRLDADKPGATRVWQSKKASEKDTDALHSTMSTPFLEDGYIYGVCSYGQLRCLKAGTGERVWETFAATTGGEPVRWANAFLVKNGGRFFLFNEKGDLIIAKLTPQGYEEISRGHLLEPTNTDPHRPVVWSHPAFANRSVYARNDREIVCASLAAD
ncbi:MAG: outer membrane protein assembly factor BamB [Chthoniobacter sp.]|nr:outer membrane protein assembly factor BamB [Chthoniobacter sp.]